MVNLLLKQATWSFVASLLTFSIAQAQTCETCVQPPQPDCLLVFEGDSFDPYRVRGCTASVSANWDEGRRTDTCNAAPPIGTAIIDYDENVKSINNGDYQISRFSAGLTEYNKEINEAYSELYEIGLELDSDYAAKVKMQWDSHLAIAERYQSQSEGVRITVSARGSNQFWDQWRGWASVSVDLDVVCTNPVDLKDQVRNKFKFIDFAEKSERYVTVINSATAPLYGLMQLTNANDCQFADGESATSYFAANSDHFIKLMGPEGTEYNGACLILGQTRLPGYSDFQTACYLEPFGGTYDLASLSSCIVN